MAIPTSDITPLGHAWERIKALEEEQDELLEQLHKAEERYIFLQKQILDLQHKLDIAVEALEEVRRTIKEIDCWTDYVYTDGVIEEALKKLKGEK